MIRLGAALEASLLAMAKFYPDEVASTNTYLQKRLPDLNQWYFIDLLRLARELDWIPSSCPWTK
jgi:hypothetical protein